MYSHDVLEELENFQAELDERTQISNSTWNLWRRSASLTPQRSQALDVLVTEPTVSFKVEHVRGLKSLLDAKADRTVVSDAHFLQPALFIVHRDIETFLAHPSYDAIDFFLTDPYVQSYHQQIVTTNNLPIAVDLNSVGRLLALGVVAAMMELASSTLDGLRVVTEELFGTNTWSLFTDESYGLSWFDAITTYQDITTENT
mgnify:CR=1 FL=1